MLEGARPGRPTWPAKVRIFSRSDPAAAEPRIHATAARLATRNANSVVVGDFDPSPTNRLGPPDNGSRVRSTDTRAPTPDPTEAIQPDGREAAPTGGERECSVACACDVCRYGSVCDNCHLPASPTGATRPPPTGTPSHRTDTRRGGGDPARRRRRSRRRWGAAATSETPESSAIHPHHPVPVEPRWPRGWGDRWGRRVDHRPLPTLCPPVGHQTTPPV